MTNVGKYELGVGDVTEIHMFLNWIEQICDPDAKLEFPEIFQQMEKNVKIESTTKADTLNNIQFLKSLAGSLVSELSRIITRC